MILEDYNSFLFAYLKEQANILLLEVNMEGTIVYANKFACAITGKDLKGTHLANLFSVSNADPIKLLLEQKAEKMMFNVNMADDLPQTFYFSTFKNGDLTFILAELNYDEVEGLRKNLIYLNNDLNNITRELQKKNIQLGQLDQLKNQFLGMAAHDLRNPIGNIMMSSEYILDMDGKNLSDAARELLSIINTSSQFMLGLIDNLLDVVKIESGKFDLHFEETDLGIFLASVVRFNAILAKNKEIQITLNVPTVLPPILIDRDKITQVLTNLLTNAVKFSSQGTEIIVSAIQTDKEVYISVQDHGQGIPENEISMLFKPFSNVSVRSTGGEKSTGLGLSIAKSIVTHHNGRIWVESKQGQGSIFTFTLPLTQNKLS
ncbi:MAG: PAS domain-containing sensor histidine kinase [Bacteroidetes bacterium]|jgi:signal transduction histidine kinase|nr:PAS domain-containing sensor histidine kinase [Bacteroidota bacterium]